ncbi:hypothetical protein LguiA_020487 [Lonicera macranthoides]
MHAALSLTPIWSDSCSLVLLNQNSCLVCPSIFLPKLNKEGRKNYEANCCLGWRKRGRRQMTSKDGSDSHRAMEERESKSGHALLFRVL